MSSTPDRVCLPVNRIFHRTILVYVLSSLTAQVSATKKTMHRPRRYETNCSNLEPVSSWISQLRCFYILHALSLFAILFVYRSFLFPTSGLFEIVEILHIQKTPVYLTYWGSLFCGLSPERTRKLGLIVYTIW
jgi:hypothetical protein